MQAHVSVTVDLQLQHTHICKITQGTSEQAILLEWSAFCGNMHLSTFCQRTEEDRRVTEFSRMFPALRSQDIERLHTDWRWHPDWIYSYSYTIDLCYEWLNDIDAMLQQHAQLSNFLFNPSSNFTKRRFPIYLGICMIMQFSLKTSLSRPQVYINLVICFFLLLHSPPTDAHTLSPQKHRHPTVPSQEESKEGKLPTITRWSFLWDGWSKPGAAEIQQRRICHSFWPKNENSAIIYSISCHSEPVWLSLFNINLILQPTPAQNNVSRWVN